MPTRRGAMIVWTRRFAATGFWLVVLSGELKAQAPCPTAAGEPYLRCQVDRPTALRSLSGLPTLPATQSGKGFPQLLRAAFVIDTTGRAEIASLVVDSVAQNEFVIAIRNSLARLRFVPARHRGTAVRQVFNAAFEFYDDVALTPPIQLDSARRVRVLPNGTTLIGIARELRDSASARSISGDDIVLAARQVLRRIASSERGTSTLAVCLDFATVDASFVDRRLAERISSREVHVALSHECPDLDESRWPKAPARSDDKPRQFVSISRVEPWNAHQIYFSLASTIEHRARSSTALYVCSAMRESASGNKADWKASCGANHRIERLPMSVVP